MPPTPQDELTRRIRKNLENTMGKAFADKASDDLILSLAPAPVARGASVEAAAADGGAGGPAANQPIVLELEPDAVEEETRRRLEGVDTALAAGVGRAMPEGASEEDRRRVGGQLRRALRSSTSQEMRRYFESRSRTLRDLLEEQATAGVDMMGSGPEQARPFVQTCWLNSTASTATFTPALAEIAASDEVRALDVPRRLTREVDETGVLIGGVGFRDRFAVGGEGVIVAVIDSEVDVTHPRYGGRVEAKANFTGEGWGAVGDHGTVVAGIVHEIAPLATLWNYKVFAQKWWLDSNDFGGSLAIQQALEDGAHVANCSWGAGPVGDGTSREARACNTAWSFGLVLVKSAGNAGPGAGSLTTPADADGIIVVGATDRTGASLGDYSSRGPTRHGLERPHLVAPGGSRGPGLGIRSTLPGNRFDFNGNDGFGTSFAAPHVSAAVALLLEHDGELTPDQIRDHLLSCCSPLGGLGANDQGAGLLDLLSVPPPGAAETAGGGD
jgi:serine protease AprX